MRLRIIHADTKEKHNKLMEELQIQGYIWVDGRQPTEFLYYGNLYEKDIVVIVEEMRLSYADLDYVKKEYPNIKIESYRPKSNKVYCVVGTNRILKEETIIALFSTVEGASNFIKNDEYLFCLYDLDVKEWEVLD